MESKSLQSAAAIFFNWNEITGEEVKKQVSAGLKNNIGVYVLFMYISAKQTWHYDIAKTLSYVSDGRKF